MNRALTSFGILAASLAFLPPTASAALNGVINLYIDGAAQSEQRINYITIVDARTIDETLIEELDLVDYRGPVVVAQTDYNREFRAGYTLHLTFSADAMGPMADHPIFELVDVDKLDGAPMFLTDRLNPKTLIRQSELRIEARDMAGIIDTNYAAEDIYEQPDADMIRGDYLAVSHRRLPGEWEAQEIFGAHVFDISRVSSHLIAEVSGVRFDEDQSLGLIVNSSTGELAAGFEERAKFVWLFNSPDSNSADSNSPDSVNADGTSNNSDVPSSDADVTTPGEDVRPRDDEKVRDADVRTRDADVRTRDNEKSRDVMMSAPPRS